MTELWHLGAEEAARRARAGEVSAVELLEACLERTLSTEPRVAAFLALFEKEARGEAEAVDRKRAAGEPLGPLAGVPVALKDNISVSGRPLTCGSRILRGYVSPYSATVVERLRAADAVLFGRCNLDEFAMGSSCENSAFQMTRNPWNLGCVPGGSSGGAAAAVAAANAPLAFGSDTGGSVRQPAALSGVVGLRPTYGRVSRHGLVAFASSLDQIGPLCRSTRDAALALEVMAGPDRFDSTVSTRPVPPYLSSIEEGIEGLKLGVVREVDIEALPAAVQADWQASLKRLEALGAELRPVSIPHLTASVACYYVLATSEASANLARFDGVRYGHRSSDPRSLGELYRHSRGEGFGAEVKRRIMLGTFALSAGYYDAYYGRAQGVREVLRQQFAAVFEKVDALIGPTAPSGAFDLGERTEDPLAMYLSDVFTTPASLVGAPAISVPSGLDDRGLPLGLQVTARPFDEATAFRIARAFERSTGFRTEPSFVEPKNL